MKEFSSSLGIDLVELKKARRFYFAHRSRLEHCLAPEEAAFVRRSRRRAEALARVLAGKEAVLKALPPASQTGPQTLRGIRMIPGKTRWSFRVPGKSPISLKRSRLSFFSNKRYVIALLTR